MEVAGLLVEAGARVDATDPDGRTPLMMAAAFNRSAMVRWLLDRRLPRSARSGRSERTGHRDAMGAMGAADAATLLAS
jgi:ankyrin repeat protein